MSNVSWREMFPDAQIKVLARVKFSYHHPILIILVMRVINKAPRPFKFESSWLVDDSYYDMLKIYRRQYINMRQKMEKSKETINSWKGNSFEHVLGKKKEYMARLNDVQQQIKL